MSLAWRISNAIMALFFGLATYVQHNDEFAVFWILVYFIPCIICILVVLQVMITRAHFQTFLYILIAFYMAFSCYLFYRVVLVVLPSDNYNLLHYQEGKEMFGVLIIETWLLIVVYFLNARVPFDSLLTKTAKGSIVLLSLSPLGLWIYHGCFGQNP